MTTLPLVPPLVLFLAKHPMVDKFDLSSLQAISSGAAPLARDLEIGVAKRLPGLVAVLQGHCLFVFINTNLLFRYCYFRNSFSSLFCLYIF